MVRGLFRTLKLCLDARVQKYILVQHPVVPWLLEHTGLLLSVTADKVIRLVPPLILSIAEADEIVAILAPIVKAFLSEPAPQ